VLAHEPVDPVIIARRQATRYGRSEISRSSQPRKTRRA